MLAFVLIPSFSQAATVAYSTDFSTSVNLVVKENKNPAEQTVLKPLEHELPYGQGIESEVPAVFKESDSLRARSSNAKDARFPTGLWLLGSALLAMVGYKRMRNPHQE
jgi:hypothetical protein